MEKHAKTIKTVKKYVKKPKKNLHENVRKNL